MFARHPISSSIRRRVMAHSAPSLRRNLASRDILERSSKPTTAPPRLNIYRDIWPPLITCSGIALVVFYGLELWRLNLAYKYRLQDMAIETEALKAQVEQLRQENEEKSKSLASKMFGRASDDKRDGRSKWFGLF